MEIKNIVEHKGYILIKVCSTTQVFYSLGQDNSVNVKRAVL